MKTIYTAELNAKLPVIVYVAPDGARAASAGRLDLRRRPTCSRWRRRRTSARRRRSTRAAQNLGSRPAAQGDQRRGRLADRARRRAPSQHDVAGEGRARRVEPHRRAGAEDERHRPRSRRACPRCCGKLDGYRTKDAQRPFTLHLAGAQIDTVEARLLHAAAERADRPEHPQPALPRRHRRHRLRDLPPRHRAARRARRRRAAARRCSASPSCRSRGAGSR